MFRSVPLPPALPGHLYLHSLPGRHEPMAAIETTLTAQSVDRVISLTGLAEIRAKSPAFAQAIEAGLPWPRTEFAIADFGVPADQAAFLALAQEMAEDLRRGESLLVHCGAGIGRTGTLATCALICLGMDEVAALHAVHQAGAGPETAAQAELVRWVAAHPNPTETP